MSDGVNLYEEGMLGYNRAGGTDDRSCLDVYVDMLVYKCILHVRTRCFG